MLTDSAHIEFRPEFRIGIDIIDEQHEVLFDLINRIGGLLLAAATDTVAVDRAIEDLVNYALYHFSIEEGVASRRNHLVELDEHIREHNEFRRKVNDHWDAAQDKRLGNEVRELQTYLKHWIVRHILGNDVPLFRQINQQSAPTSQQHLTNSGSE